jgi:CTP synthase
VLSDAYLSVLKALQHACMAAGLKLHLVWVEAQFLEPEAKSEVPEKYETAWRQVGGWV